jgi:hypothetical protein
MCSSGGQEGQNPQTIKEFDVTGKTSASLCREKGWVVGDILEDDSQPLYPRRIVITAIGEAQVLAKKIFAGRTTGDEGYECPWMLCPFRNEKLIWKKVPSLAESLSDLVSTFGYEAVAAALKKPATQEPDNDW